MDILMIVLRLMHIFGAIFWVGASFMMVLYIEPALHEIGPAGQPFAAHLFGSGKLSQALGIAAVSTIISGILLYWKDSNGLNIDWLRTGQGIVFTIGGLAGLAASGIGMVVIGPISDKLSQVQREMAAAGGPPAPEKLALIESLQKRMASATRLDFYMMIVAVLGMATARYFTFTL